MKIKNSHVASSPFFSQAIESVSATRGGQIGTIVHVRTERPLVALIDERRLVRDSVASLLCRFAPDLAIASIARPEECDLASLSAAVIWVECSTPDPLGRLARKVEAIREHASNCAITALIECDDFSLLRSAMNLRLNLVRLKTATRDIILASIRLTLAGGMFMSSDLLRRDIFKDEELPEATISHSPEKVTSKDPRRIATPLIDSHRLPERTPLDGSSKLTRRELDILARVDRGLQNKTIAYELGISCCTVKVHIQNIMKKLNARNRTQIAFLIRQMTASREHSFLPEPNGFSELGRKLDS